MAPLHSVNAWTTLDERSKGPDGEFLGVQGVSFVPLQGGCHANAVTVAGGGHSGPARTGTSTGGACADACTVTGSRQACEHPVCPGIRHAEFRGSDYYHATVVCSVVRSPNASQRMRCHLSAHVKCGLVSVLFWDRLSSSLCPAGSVCVGAAVHQRPRPRLRGGLLQRERRRRALHARLAGRRPVAYLAGRGLRW